MDVRILCQKIANTARVICNFCVPFLRILRKFCAIFQPVFSVPHFTLVKEALIEIGCVVTSLVVMRVHCGQMVHPRPIVTMEH